MQQVKRKETMKVSGANQTRYAKEKNKTKRCCSCQRIGKAWFAFIFAQGWERLFNRRDLFIGERKKKGRKEDVRKLLFTI
jgi:Fe-S cluster biosynthesis and repair protein YggX